MATVDFAPDGFDAGAPVLDSPSVGIIVAVTPDGISTGTPEITDPDIVILPETWPYRALLPIAESLEWLTDVLTSRTGEQRIALRSAPRQIVQYGVRLNSDQFARAKDFARRRAHTVIGMPVWAEHIDLGFDLSSADTTIAVDTTYCDWRVDGIVMIWESPEKFALCRISSITDTELGLLGPIGTDFTSPTIAPLRPALPIEGFSIAPNKVFSEVSVKFQVTDNTALDEDAGYPQYQSLDVLTEPPALINEVAESIVRAAEYVDNGFGPIAVETLRTYVDFGQTISFHETRGSALWRRRAWLHSLKGKQKTFWMPTFNQDFALQADIGSSDTVISVLSIGTNSSYAGRHVMIMLADGTRFIRQVMSVAADGDNQDVTISSSLGQAVTVAEISMFCFIALSRLNADQVSIDHRFELASAISVPVIEVPA